METGPPPEFTSEMGEFPFAKDDSEYKSNMTRKEFQVRPSCSSPRQTILNRIQFRCFDRAVPRATIKVSTALTFPNKATLPAALASSHFTLQPASSRIAVPARCPVQ